MNKLSISLFATAALSTSISTANQITPLSQCVQSVREAALRHQEVKRNPLTYLAIAGGGGAAINKKKLNKWSVLTTVEMRDAQDEAGAEKYQQRVKEFRKRYALSGLPQVSSDPKFQSMLDYVAKEFELSYERRVLQAEMNGVTKELIKDPRILNKISPERAHSMLIPSPGVREEVYIKAVRTGYFIDANMETLRDTYRKTRLIEGAIAQNSKELDALRADPANASYKQLTIRMGDTVNDFSKAMSAKDAEKAKEVYKKSLESALASERSRLSDRWVGGDVFDRMKAAASGPGARAGMVAGAAGGMFAHVETAKAQCGGDLRTDEATHLLPFVHASVAGGCELSDMGAEALIMLPDQEVSKLCEQIPTLPTVLANAEMSFMNRLAELPKFTKVEPSCGTSTLKVEMSNGRKYALSFPSNDGRNFEVVGQATGKVQRVIDFAGKYDGKTGEYAKLTSKQRNAGGSADPGSETPKAIFNSYLNSANDKQDSSVESKTIMAEGANMAQAFLPLFNARCGTGGSGTSESPTISH